MRYAALHIRRSYLHSILLPNVAAGAMCSHADGSTHGYVGSGSTPAVISPLALGPLHPSHPTFMVRVGTSRWCHSGHSPTRH
jgi:hypothetical protein